MANCLSQSAASCSIKFARFDLKMKWKGDFMVRSLPFQFHNKKLKCPCLPALKKINLKNFNRMDSMTDGITDGQMAPIYLCPPAPFLRKGGATKIG